MSEGSDETTVVVDLNEPSGVRMLSLSHPDVDNWREEVLDAADIVVNGVGIERKTPSDFASSMTEDRLDGQVRKLADIYEDAAILLEGGFDDFAALGHTRLKPESAKGKAAAIHMRWGIPVVPTGGQPGTDEARGLLVDYATRLGRKATEEPSSGFLQSSDAGVDQPLGKRLWGCYEAVGPTRADALFEAHGSPVEFYSLAMDTRTGGLHPTAKDSLCEVEGIGETTAERLISQLEWEEDPGPSSDGEPSQDVAQARQQTPEEES